MSRRGGFVGAALVALCTAACGGKGAFDRAFTTRWQDDRGASIASVQARLSGARAPSGTPLAVGVTSGALVGLPLSSGAAWSHAFSPNSLPQIAGDLVLASGKGKLVALRANDGSVAWEVGGEGRLHGAGDDGKVTVVTLGHDDASKPGVLLAVARNGTVLHRLSAQSPLGRPAALAGVAFVPWGHQYVSAVDLASGKEVGRLLLREQVSHALSIDGWLYFGQLGLTRFDGAIAAATRGGAHRVTLPERGLPGDPVWLADGTRAVPPSVGARARVRLYARPAEREGALGLAGDQYAATYFRIALGLSARGGKVSWVKTLPADVLGGAAGRDGFALCDAAGRVHLVHTATASAAEPKELGARLSACVVEAADLSIEAVGAAQSLADQLAQAIQLNDPEMVAIQRFLLKDLGALEEPRVTQTLIELSSSPRTAPVLRSAAEAALAARRNGVEFMLRALEQHYDYLADTLRLPPVGALADALRAMGERRAAPLLVAQLNDPANHPKDVLRVARALEVLATKDELGALETFFTLYRATAQDAELVGAVLAVARTMLALRDEAAKDVVVHARRDRMTVPGVAQGLAKLLARSGDESDEAPAESRNHGAPGGPDKGQPGSSERD